MANEWGPLGALAGEWESDKGGLDTAFSHSQGKVLGTPYLEKCTMKPFGPVDLAHAVDSLLAEGRPEPQFRS